MESVAPDRRLIVQILLKFLQYKNGPKRIYDLLRPTLKDPKFSKKIVIALMYNVYAEEVQFYCPLSTYPAIVLYYTYFILQYDSMKLHFFNRF